MPGGNPQALPKPQAGGSFLDEWLAKRKSAPGPVAASTNPASTPQIPSAASTGPAKTEASATSIKSEGAQKSGSAASISSPNLTPEKAKPQPEKPGELKITHHDSNSAKPADAEDGEQVHTVRIDRDGNLTTYDQ
jgi:hypothetical protein